MEQIKKELKSFAEPGYDKKVQRYFKTGQGEYGEGDFFIGVKLPHIRSLARKYFSITLGDLQLLAKSKVHEERSLAALILVQKYDRSKTDKEQGRIFKAYCRNFKSWNNWDLVDISCPYIVGKHLLDDDKSILFDWIKSKHLWTRRIAIVSNWWFIRKGDLSVIYRLSEQVLKDREDLMHKATGWMLREAWKKDPQKTDSFLKKNYSHMPRVMLRYAIEKHPEVIRRKYLKGSI